MLNSLQRIPLLKITRAYSTVSTVAIQVLAGVLPINLTCEKYKNLFRLKFKGEKLGGYELNIETHDVDWDEDSRIPPWEIFYIKWTRSDWADKRIMIYTDGSKIHNRLGFAFIVVVDGNIIHSAQFRVSDHGTVYRCEVLAIAKAVDYIIANNLDDVYIRTDSMSALQALSVPSGNPLIIALRQKIKNSNLKINFTWVQAHVGEHFNEIVDTLAKEATRKEYIDFEVGYSIKQVKNLQKKYAMLRWQYDWDNEEKGRSVYAHFTKVSLERLEGNFFLNQVYTGHGAIPSYQAKFHNRTSDCWCGAQNGTLHHLIFECRIFDTIRDRWFPFNYKDVSIKNLCISNKSRQGLVEILDKCLQSYLDVM